jgi:peptidoglycan/LPS O-acetylase OafA/YrhL
MIFLFIWVLFQNSKNSKLDGYIGELSYPIYILHLPVLWAVEMYIKPPNIISVVIMITLFVSMIFISIQRVIDRYRHSFAKRTQSLISQGL